MIDLLFRDKVTMQILEYILTQKWEVKNVLKTSNYFKITPLQLLEIMNHFYEFQIITLDEENQTAKINYSSELVQILLNLLQILSDEKINIGEDLNE